MLTRRVSLRYNDAQRQNYPKEIDMPTIKQTAQEAAQNSLRFVKNQAKRPDTVGDVTHRALELAHGGAGAAARALSRFQEAIQPPARYANKRTPATRRKSA
jgi:hypothetical protein